MQRFDVLLRWMGAVGITLTPLFFFVLPSMLTVGYDTAEEQFRALVDESTGLGSRGFVAQLVQLCAPVFLMLASIGIGGFTIARGRGRTLGAIGLIVGMVSAISALVCLGIELGMFFFLTTATDADAAVAQALAWVSWPPFVISLWGALFGLILTLPILALALWRSRMVPIFVPLLFGLPLVIAFLPYSNVSNTVSYVAMLVPCVWMAVQLIRGTPRGVDSITPATAVLAEQKDEVDS